MVENSILEVNSLSGFVVVVFLMIKHIFFCKFNKESKFFGFKKTLERFKYVKDKKKIKSSQN